MSTTGSPYPIKLVNTGGKGTITFGQWDERFAIAAPAKSYDLTQLKTLVGG